VITPLQQAAAEALTTAAIDLNAKDDAAKLARAMAAQAVANVFKTAAGGDFAGALAELRSMLGSISDPGEATLVNTLYGYGAPLLSAEAQIIAAMPVVGTLVVGWLTATAAGMSTVAAAYIAKYGPTSAPK
jgi:hypothetical protein